MIDDRNINDLAKNQLFAVFNSHTIRRSMSPKSIELCRKTPCLCPLENTNKLLAAITEQKHLLLSFAIGVNIFTLEFRHIEINASSSANTI